MSNKSKDEEIKELRTRNAELEQENKKLSESIKDYCEINFGGHEETVKELLKLRTRVAEQGQELEQKYDDDVDTYESLFLLGIDPAGKTTAECINELGEHIQSLESKLSTLLKASEGMEKALEYFGNENSWNVDPDSSYLEMKRPGGGFQDGIVLVSHNLRPWVLAKQALADFRALKGTK